MFRWFRVFVLVYLVHAEHTPPPCPQLQSMSINSTEISFHSGCGLSPASLELLCSFPMLHHLMFEHQAIGELPKCFVDLKDTLSILLIFSGGIQEFPPMLASFPQLRMLSLKGNLLRHVPDEALPPTLIWLVLTGNRYGLSFCSSIHDPAFFSSFFSFVFVSASFDLSGSKKFQPPSARSRTCES